MERERETETETERDREKETGYTSDRASDSGENYPKRVAVTIS